MNQSELLLTAKTIAQSHLTSGTDLNDSITKIASTQSLSKPQIERLVEETNKATFLELFEKKGEQEFPVADYQVIKSKLTPKIEKTAAEKLHFEPLTYSDSLFGEQVGKDKIINKPLEKTANIHDFTEDEIAHAEALEKVAHQLWDHYNKFMDLEALGQQRYGVKHNEASDLIKVAEVHHDNEVLQLRELQTTLEKEAAVFEIILNKLEKTGASSFLWGETSPLSAFKNTTGSRINRVLHAAGAIPNFVAKYSVGTAAGAAGSGISLGLKGAALAAPAVIPMALRGMKNNLNATLTVGSELPRAIGKARAVAAQSRYIGPGAADLTKMGMEKKALLDEVIPATQALFKTPIVQNAMKWVGRGMGVSSAVGKMSKPLGMLGPAAEHLSPLTALASEGLSKEAGFVEGLQHALEFVTPAALWGAQAGPMGALAGFTAAAAKKLGGGIALTMNRKEFDDSFETIMKNNPDLAENKKEMRGYFDVVSRHAPSLAKDPLVAESIVKNMNAFGGTDYNTIRGLRETEALGKSGPSEKGLSGLTALFGRS